MFEQHQIFGPFEFWTDSTGFNIKMNIKLDFCKLVHALQLKYPAEHFIYKADSHPIFMDLINDQLQITKIKYGHVLTKHKFSLETFELNNNIQRLKYSEQCLTRGEEYSESSVYQVSDFDSILYQKTIQTKSKEYMVKLMHNQGLNQLFRAIVQIPNDFQKQFGGFDFDQRFKEFVNKMKLELFQNKNLKDS